MGGEGDEFSILLFQGPSLQGSSTRKANPRGDKNMLRKRKRNGECDSESQSSETAMDPSAQMTEKSEVGKVTLKSNVDESLSDEALRDESP